VIDDAMTIEPMMGEHFTCNAVVITLDRSRIVKMQPLRARTDAVFKVSARGVLLF
jgi:hypothetical protein